MIKWLFKWAFRLLMLVIVLVVALLLLKDTIARAVVTARLEQQTGLETRLAGLEIGLLTPTVTLSGLKLYDPPEFGGGLFVDLPELHVAYDPAALARGELHLTLARVNLTEVAVVMGRDGRRNVDALQKSPRSHKPNGTREHEVNFTGIDLLNLTLGRLRTVDLRQPGRDRVVEFGVKNEMVRNVKSAEDLQELATRILLRQGAAKLIESLAGAGIPRNAGSATNAPAPAKSKP